MADVRVDLLVFEPEPVEHFARPRFERVATEMLVLFLHFAEAGENAVQVAGLIGIGHRVIQSLELVMRSPTRPLPKIASSSTERPALSSTSCRK